MGTSRSTDDNFSTSQLDLACASQRLAERAQEDPSLLVDRALGHVLQSHSVVVHKDFAHMMICHADLATGRLTTQKETDAARSDIALVRIRIASYERALDQFLAMYVPDGCRDTLRAAVGSYRASLDTDEIDATQVEYWFHQLESTLKYYFGMQWRLLS